MAHRVTYLAAELGGYRTRVPSVSTKYIPELIDALLHNWEADFALEVAYSTDVVSTLQAVEERTALLPYPVRTLNLQLTGLTRTTATRVLNMLARSGMQPLPIPLSSDAARVTGATTTTSLGSTTIPCDTTYRRFFIGQQVAIVDWQVIEGSLRYIGNVEVSTVSAIADNELTVSAISSPRAAGARVYPLVFCDVSPSHELTTTTDGVISCSMQVIEKVGATQLPNWVPFGSTAAGNTFRQIPIAEFPYDWSREPSLSLERIIDIQQPARAPFIDVIGHRSKHKLTVSTAGLTRAAAVQILKFVDSRNGRLRPFWALNPYSAYTPVTLTTTYIDVLKTMSVDEVWRLSDYVGFRYRNGSTEVRQIWRVQDLGASLRLTFATALPTSRTDLNGIRAVTSAHLMRFDADAYTERWTTNESLSLEVTATETLADRDVHIPVYNETFAGGLTNIRNLFGDWRYNPAVMFKPDTTPCALQGDDIARWLDSTYGRALRTPSGPYHQLYPAQLSVRMAVGTGFFELEVNDTPHLNSLGLTVFVVLKSPAAYAVSGSNYLMRYPDAADSAPDTLEFGFEKADIYEAPGSLPNGSTLTQVDLGYPRTSVHICALVWNPGLGLSVYRDGLKIAYAPSPAIDLPTALAYAARFAKWGNPSGVFAASDAQIYRIVVYQRALEKFELNMVGGTLAVEVAGAPWYRTI